MRRIETPLGLLPESWEVVRFPVRKWQWTDSGMKVINVTNILADGSVDVHNTDRYISFDEYQTKYSHFAVDADDIVVASSGNTYGKVGRVNRSHLPLMMNTSVVRFHSLSRDRLDDDFLYAFLRSLLFRDQVEKFVVGSAQPNFGPSHLKLMVIPLPPLPTQQRIASILSAYDDLIENNTRRIKILEDMAQMLYREWFVNFRFPGHEKVRMVESELGPIPQGWSVGPMEAVCERVTDGSHWSPTTVENGRPMASSKDLHKWGLNLSTCRWISEQDFDELVRNDCRPLAGDVLITKDGANYLKYCFCVEKDMDVVLLSSVAMIRPDRTRASSHYIAFHLSDESVKKRLAGRVSGAAIPRIVLKDFRQFTILTPPIGLQRHFDEVVKPLVALCWRLIDKNVNLRTTRDLLLPKLISGEISIEAADEAAVELMEQTA